MLKLKYLEIPKILPILSDRITHILTSIIKEFFPKHFTHVYIFTQVNTTKPIYTFNEKTTVMLISILRLAGCPVEYNF